MNRRAESRRLRGQSNRRRSSGVNPGTKNRKPDKAQRAAIRTARTARLNWRIPTTPDGDPLPLDHLRELCRVERADITTTDEVSNAWLCAWIRHDLSDYDRIVHRLGRWAYPRQIFRERVAEEIAAMYPPLRMAALAAGRKETDAQRRSTAKSRDIYDYRRTADGYDR